MGLFAPKLYQLYTKTGFSRSMLLTWGESSFPTVESSVDIAGTCRRCRETDKQAKGSKEPRDKGSREIPPKPTGENGFVNPATQYCVNNVGYRI